MFKRRKLKHTPSLENNCIKIALTEEKSENTANEQNGITLNDNHDDYPPKVTQHLDVLLNENTDSVSSKKNILKVFDQMSGSNEKNTILKRVDIPLDFIRKRLTCVSEDDANNVCQILSDHCSQMLTKIMYSGTYYMHHCSRTKFTIADFEKGLFSSGEKLDKHAENFYKYANKRKQRLHTLKFERKWLNNDNPLFLDVSDLPVDLQNYFNEITKVLLYETEESCCIIWKDLKTNNCILPLMPYFVNFLSNFIDKFINNFVRMPLLLKTIHSLLCNPNLYFENYHLNLLAFTLLKFLMEELPCLNGTKGCSILKDTAANLLGKILKKTKSRKLLFDVMDRIEHVFSGNIQSLFVSQYGALAALNSIGVPSILLMFSDIEKYCEFLCGYIDDNPRSYHKMNDVYMVLGQLIHSHYLLMHHYFKYESCSHLNLEQYYFPTISKMKVFPVLLLSSFNEYFGECLVQHFPLLNFVSCNVYLKKKKVQNASTKLKTRKKHIQSYNREIYSKSGLVYKTEDIFDIAPLKNKTIKFKEINRIFH